MFEFPPIPESVVERVRAAMSLRYEDIAQDGRLLLEAIPHGLGEVLWQTALAAHPMRDRLFAQGVVPILTRIVVQGMDGPIAAGKNLEGEGAFQLAHTVGADGEVDRIVMNLWVDAYGRRGRTYGPPPPDAGERIHVGRVFAEHVFTRLFAPPGQRKVLRLEGEGIAPVPPDRYAWRAPEELLAIPPDAQPLDAELVPDETALALGLAHTDSNQHVNSLVYPRLFEEAALRRFEAHGQSTALLSRFAETAYRKPSFAGERVRFLLRAFRWRSHLGAVGALVDDRGPDTRPRCWARMLFEP